MTTPEPAAPIQLPAASRVRVDSPDPQQGLARLVLTVVELLRQLMERQAIRRMEHGDLTAEQLEQLGGALMALAEQMAGMCDYFGLSMQDLNLDLGPLGSLLPRDPASSAAVDHQPPG